MALDNTSLMFFLDDFYLHVTSEFGDAGTILGSELRSRSGEWLTFTTNDDHHETISHRQTHLNPIYIAV